MGMWSHFDAAEIDEDFARIAGLGLDSVRFFLTWETFQPAADTISSEMLDRFIVVLDLAHARGLRAMPTLFCGHMSGVNWLPAWTLDSRFESRRFRTLTAAGPSPYGIGDFYTGALLDAQRALARAAGERARNHPALLAWDLGNEFSNLREPQTPDDAVHWSAALTHDLFASSNIGATGGLHGEDLGFDRNIRPSSIAAPWDFATMHGYSVYSDFARTRRDPEVVPFLYALTAAFSDKRVLFSEFGNPTCPAGRPHEAGGLACLSEQEMTVYAHQVLDRLQHRGALGAFWWCWADYAAELAQTPPFDRAPHELTFGIVRNDGSEKPVAATLAAFARERREVGSPQYEAFGAENDFYAGLPKSLALAYAFHCEANNLSQEVS